MVMLDTLANAMASLTNAEMRAKKEVVIAPASKLIINVMRLLQREGYVGEIEYIDDGRQGKLKVQLLGRINKAGVIKPRFSVKAKDLATMPPTLRKHLPSKEIGVLILSTPYGVLSHKEALSKKTGGVLLGYVY
jgi:small subunit ribosomal protein S8